MTNLSVLLTLVFSTSVPFNSSPPLKTLPHSISLPLSHFKPNFPSNFPSFSLVSPLSSLIVPDGGPAGTDLWRWTWSRCVNTVTSACRKSWSGAWPNVNATLANAERKPSPSVCNPYLSFSFFMFICFTRSLSLVSVFNLTICFVAFMFSFQKCFPVGMDM